MQKGAVPYHVSALAAGAIKQTMAAITIVDVTKRWNVLHMTENPFSHNRGVFLGRCLREQAWLILP